MKNRKSDNRSKGLGPSSGLDLATLDTRFERLESQSVVHSVSAANVCRTCGEDEVVGELRHSFVHATLRQLVNPDALATMPRGPFYAASPTWSTARIVPKPHRRGPAHRRQLPGRSVAFKVGSGIMGIALVGGGAYGATNWIVGLNAGSSGEGQAATVNNLTISAVASPAATNLLYPGATGDVVLTITNPNVFPVTITGVDLPTSTTYATGFSASNLTGTIAGCASGTSDVLWNYSTVTSGSAHTLTSPLTVGGGSTLTVTLTNDASMTSAAPAACESAYLSMPALTGIVASGGAATATTSPATDSWTS